MKSIVMLCAILSVAWCASSGVARGQSLSDNAKQAAHQANQFGWDLYHRLCAEQATRLPPKGNLFMSPYSIDTALAMTYGGARGLTAQQMATTLHFDQGADLLHQAMGELIADINSEQGADPTKTFLLVVANALWVQKGLAINPDYQKLVNGPYAAALRDVDFSGGPAAIERSRQTINDWVAKQTQDKIKDLLAKGTVDAATQLVLTNAIYFKSVWQTPFDKKATRDEAFHTGVADVDVPMMHQKHKFAYTEGDGVQLLGLPYQNGLLTMVVVLPQKAEQFAEAEKALDAKKLDQWLGAMRTQEVVVSLPRFKFSTGFSLATTLQAMGMTEAFRPGADYSGMLALVAGQPPSSLSISQVMHKAFIDVNEESTEAAGATGVVMRQTAIRREEPVTEFKADHPFVFMIRDNASGVILFVGRVSNPKE